MSKDIILIGGAHIDIAGIPEHRLRQGEKNYGKVTFTAGGVAYNVACNLSLMGIQPKLVSLICDDNNSRIILDACAHHNIDISDSLFLQGHTTPNYLYIVDSNGDSHIGISDTKLYECITPEFLQNKIDLINSFKVCFIDANLSHDAIKYLLTYVNIPTMIDPVSVDHCSKIADIIHLAHTIKPNDKELEALSGISLGGEESLQAAKNYFTGKGVQNVFFSLGKRGLYYGDKHTANHIVHKIENVANTNGAGDAMMAGLIYGTLNNMNLNDMAKIGIAAACITMQSLSPDKKDLTIQNIQKETEKIK